MHRKFCIGAIALLALACNRTNVADVSKPYYGYDFTGARKGLRDQAYAEKHKETVLYNAKLGMASLAAGDVDEANKTLSLCYKLMESGKVNTSSRIAAATIISDNITVWKGEPFEQAMAYYAYAVSRALAGDWENTRAAIRGSLRKLHDFSEATAKKNKKGETVPGNPDSETLAKTAVEAEEANKKKGYDYIAANRKYVETDFALGYLIQGLAEHQLGASGAGLRSAVALNPQLKPLAERIRKGAYNTVLIVDYGRGPTKYNYGMDRVFTSWKPMEIGSGADLQVAVENKSLSVLARPVCSVNQMSLNHRWKNLENAREAKSKLGTALIVGGAATAAYGSDEAAVAGAIMMLIGAAAKASAAASIRHNELLPHTTYVTVLTLPKSKTPHAVRVQIADDPAGAFVVPRVWPGTPKNPRVIYLRLFKPIKGARIPSYFQSTDCRYRNSFEKPRRGDFPYILGGTCVARPTEKVLKTYQAGGYLRGISVGELKSVYRAEGIVFNAGPYADGKWSDANYTHVLEGGKVLATPNPYTVGYKRLMYKEHRPYKPTSKRVRALAEETREIAAQKS